MKTNINYWMLVALAYVAAALGNSVVCLICFLVVAYCANNAEMTRQSFYAIGLCFANSIVARFFSIIHSVLDWIGIPQISTVSYIITSTCNTIVGIVVFVSAIYAAMNTIKQNPLDIPYLSKNLKTIIVDEK